MKRALFASIVCAAALAVVVPAAPIQAQGGGGTIEGHVRLTGPAPGNPIIRMGRDPICARLNAGKRPIQEIVVRAADGGLSNAFVEVQGSFPNTPVSSEAVVIRQSNCQYAPRVVGARVGQTLRIVNSDTLVHNVHSSSSKGNDFNETQPHSDMVFNYTLKAQEEMLHIKCDVHSWMHAYVGVTTNPYFAVSGQDGAFKISNVPPGHYTMRAWHERYGWVTQNVDVKAGATATVDFAYTGNERPSTASLHEIEVPVV
jgi:plastocyanin